MTMSAECQRQEQQRGRAQDADPPDDAVPQAAQVGQIARPARKFVVAA